MIIVSKISQYLVKEKYNYEEIGLIKYESLHENKYFLKMCIIITELKSQ